MGIEQNLKLSIIMPVYNEKNTVLKILNKALAADILGLEKEIIIINDCSTDGSDDLLKTINNQVVKIFNHDKNQGKGAAIKTGLKYVTGDIVLIQDADLEYDPDDYKKLLQPILNNQSMIVYGSRFQNKSILSNFKNSIPIHYLGNKIISIFLSLLFLKNINDIETCYKCFTKDVLIRLDLKSNDFRIEPEITIQFIKNKFKIIEVPISYYYRSHKQGKKINWQDGIKALYFILINRLTNNN